MHQAWPSKYPLHNDLHHGNLPCSCDRDPATVRSCVTTAKIPGSPTVVAGGASGDIAARFGRWPPAKALSRLHRTFCSMGRYKGPGTTHEQSQPFGFDDRKTSDQPEIPGLC